MKRLLVLAVGTVTFAAHPALAFSELRAKAKIEFVRGGDANRNKVFDPGDWVRTTIRVTNWGKRIEQGIAVEFPIHTMPVGQIRSIEGYNADYTDPSRIRWVNQTFLPQETKTYRFEGTVKALPKVSERYFLQAKAPLPKLRSAPGPIEGVRMFPETPDQALHSKQAEPILASLGPPQLVSLTPSQGRSLSGSITLFTTAIRDPDGWQDLREVYLLFTDDLNNARPIYLRYDVEKNRFFVRNPENTAWIGQASDKGSIIQAGPVRLDAKKSSARGSEDLLMVHWMFTIGEELAGRTYEIYSAAVEKSWKATPWLKGGQWTIVESK